MGDRIEQVALLDNQGFEILGHVIEGRASWPMSERGEIAVRSCRCPLPRRAAVRLSRSRSRQCGSSQTYRQMSSAAPIRAFMAQ